MKKSTPFLIITVAILLGTIMRIDVFTLPIQGDHAWRQSLTGWNIRNFVRHDPNILNPRQGYWNRDTNIARYEFPLMQWSIAMVERVIGENILVKRVCVYLFSLLCLFTVFRISMVITSNHLVSAAAVWTFNFFPIFYFFSVNVMPDILALFFGLHFILYYLTYASTGNRRILFISAVLLCLAGLVKLPFILLGILPLLDFVNMSIQRENGAKKHFLLFSAALVPVVAWYLAAANNIDEGFSRDFAGVTNYMRYLKIQLLTVIPARLLNIPSLVLGMVGVYYMVVLRNQYKVERRFVTILSIVMILYLLAILNTIGQGDQYYLMPFYPVLIIPVIVGLHKLGVQVKFGKPAVIALMCLMPILCWSVTKDKWKLEKPYTNDDIFVCSELLKTIAPPNDRVIVVNDQSMNIFLYAIDNQGYFFQHNRLKVEWIKGLAKNEGVKYLFSDSRTIESQIGFEDAVDKLVDQCGSINVYSLK